MVKNGDIETAAAWKGRVALLTTAHGLGTLNIMTVLAIAPILQDDLALSVASFGLVVSCYHGALALSGLVAGSMVDRLGVRWSLCLAMLLLVIGALIFAGAGSFAAAALAAAFMGVGYGFVNPCSATGVHNWVPYGWRATAMAVKQTGVPLGGVLAAYGGIMAVFFDWRWVFAVIAAITLTSIGLFVLLPARAQRSTAVQPTFIANFGQLLRIRNLTALNLSTGGFNICQSGFFAFLTSFVREGLMAGQSLASLCFGLAQMASAVGRILLGLGSDRYLSHRRTVLYMVVGCLASLGFVGFALIGPGWTGTLLGLVILLGATIGGYAALVQTIIVETVGRHQTGSATGYHLFVVATGGMIGPPLFGWVVDSTSGFAGAWLLLAGVGVASILILVFGYRAER